MKMEFFQLPDTPEEPEKGFSFKRFEDGTKKRFEELAGVSGWKLEGDFYRKFCAALSSVEGVESDPEVVETSLKEFCGHKATKDVVERMIKRVEACRAILDSNKAIPDWTGTPDIWSYAVVRDVEIEKNKVTGKSIAFLECEFFSNIVAGRVYRLAFPPGYLKKILHDTGYPAYVPAHPREIMNFHFNVMLGRTGFGRVGALQIKATSAQKKRNRGLVWDRDNSRNGCKLYIPCCECRMGVDICPNACRKTTTVEEFKDDATKASNDVREQRQDVQSREGHHPDSVPDNQRSFDGGHTGQTGS